MNTYKVTAKFAGKRVSTTVYTEYPNEAFEIGSDKLLELHPEIKECESEVTVKVVFLPRDWIKN